MNERVFWASLRIFAVLGSLVSVAIVFYLLPSEWSLPQHGHADDMVHFGLLYAGTTILLWLVLRAKRLGREAAPILAWWASIPVIYAFFPLGTWAGVWGMRHLRQSAAIPDSCGKPALQRAPRRWWSHGAWRGWLALAVIATVCAECGLATLRDVTAAFRFDYPSVQKVYGGVRMDCRELGDCRRHMRMGGSSQGFSPIPPQLFALGGMIRLPFVILDLPMSFVADTLVLPYTIPRQFRTKRQVALIVKEKERIWATYLALKDQPGTEADFRDVLKTPEHYKDQVLCAALVLMGAWDNPSQCYYGIKPEPITASDRMICGYMACTEPVAHQVSLTAAGGGDWQDWPGHRVKFWCSGSYKTMKDGLLDTTEWVLLSSEPVTTSVAALVLRAPGPAVAGDKLPELPLAVAGTTVPAINTSAAPRSFAGAWIAEFEFERNTANPQEPRHGWHAFNLDLEEKVDMVHGRMSGRAVACTGTVSGRVQQGALDGTMRLSWDQHDWDSLTLQMDDDHRAGTGMAVFGASATEKHYYSIELKRR